MLTLGGRASHPNPEGRRSWGKPARFQGGGGPYRKRHACTVTASCALNEPLGVKRGRGDCTADWIDSLRKSVGIPPSSAGTAVVRSIFRQIGHGIIADSLGESRDETMPKGGMAPANRYILSACPSESFWQRTTSWSGRACASCSRPSRTSTW